MSLESDAQLEHVHRTPTRPPHGPGGQWTDREEDAVPAAMRGHWAGGNRSPGALSRVIADPGPWPPALTPVLSPEVGGSAHLSLCVSEFSFCFALGFARSFGFDIFLGFR